MGEEPGGDLSPAPPGRRREPEPVSGLCPGFQGAGTGGALPEDLAQSKGHSCKPRLLKQRLRQSDDTGAS